MFNNKFSGSWSIVWSGGPYIVFNPFRTDPNCEWSSKIENYFQKVIQITSLNFDTAADNQSSQTKIRDKILGNPRKS